MNEERIRKLNTFSVPKRPDMDSVVKRLGQEDLAAQEWLVLTPRDKLPQPKKESYPRPAKRDDGSYIYDKIPSSAEATRSSQPHQMLYKKRAAVIIFIDDPLQAPRPFGQPRPCEEGRAHHQECRRHHPAGRQGQGSQLGSGRRCRSWKI